MELSSPIIFKLQEKTYRVKQKKWMQTKFKDDCAYLLSKYNDYVYPYRGEISTRDQAYQPGIYKYKDEVIVVRPKTDYEKKLYSKNRLITLTPESIFKNLSDDIINAPEVVITDGDIFKPQIKPTDDMALAAMKFGIGEKNINFNSYANKFSDVATKNNGRRALTHGNTLKMDMLARFADVFDINAALLIWDKEGCPNPMSKDRDTAYIIFNGDEINLKDPSIKIQVITRKD